MDGWLRVFLKFFLTIWNTDACYSTPSLENPETTVDQNWLYEVFVIHYDLIYEPFDS